MTPVAVIAAATAAFHLATASIYGYHRDEFYYLVQQFQGLAVDSTYEIREGQQPVKVPEPPLRASR